MPFKIIFFFGAVDSNSKSRSELERSRGVKRSMAAVEDAKAASGLEVNAVSTTGIQIMMADFFVLNDYTSSSSC